MRAAVEAAEDWGTYVTVHAYHDRSVRRAIEAGVKCVEHGQLLSEDTLRLMAEREVWLSLQNLMADSPNMLESRRLKRKPVIEGQDRVWPLAKRLGVKLAWGTLILVNGDPIADSGLLADPGANFAVIMKDGVIVKDAP